MRLLTRNSERRTRLLALGGVLLAFACAAPATALADSGTVLWEPSATEFWTVNQNALLGAFQNGQCVQWAADKRPDIVQRGMEAIVSKELADHQPEYLGDWSARYWAQYADYAGIPTGTAPRRGAVAVFQPGVLGAAAPDGHVAYVEKVTKKGRVLISQMHAPVLGQVTLQWLSRRQARSRGLTYIYR